MEKVDNKKLVQMISLPGIEEIDNATVAQITELKTILVKYEALLGKIIRSRL